MTILITGSTDGIGKQTALEMAQRGHHILIHGRSQQRLEKTRDWILEQVPESKISLFKADFAVLSEVKQLAETLLDSSLLIDVLINNAGVFENNLAYTADGYERTFAINHLAPFYLTYLLLPQLKTRPAARIINVASNAQASHIDFNCLNAENGYDAYRAYELSKLCNVLFTFKLARKLDSFPVTVNALHPGVISTKILHSGWGMGGGSLHQGAGTSVFLATSVEGGETSGHYYENKQKSRASKAAYDIDNQDMLWEKSLNMCCLRQ